MELDEWYFMTCALLLDPGVIDLGFVTGGILAYTEKTLLQRIAIRCNLYAVIVLQRSNSSKLLLH